MLYVPFRVAGLPALDRTDFVRVIDSLQGLFVLLTLLYMWYFQFQRTSIMPNKKGKVDAELASTCMATSAVLSFVETWLRVVGGEGCSYAMSKKPNVWVAMYCCCMLCFLLMVGSIALFFGATACVYLSVRKQEKKRKKAAKAAKVAKKLKGVATLLTKHTSQAVEAAARFLGMKTHACSNDESDREMQPTNLGMSYRSKQGGVNVELEV